MPSVSSISNELLKDKFKACLAGVLIGDCFGVPFEGRTQVSKSELRAFFNRLSGSDLKHGSMQYSDDTIMTKNIAESLIANKGLNVVNIAKRFTDAYFAKRNRGYGKNVVSIFSKWRSTNFEDLWGPAKNQFSGEGSLGNGGAMRIAPVALFCHSNSDQLLDMVTSVTKLTHTNPLGIGGALLQSLAIQEALMLNSKDGLNATDFLFRLRDKIQTIEATLYDNFGFGLKKDFYYTNRIDAIDELLRLAKTEDVPNETVISKLGNDVCALTSVPTALFCFLRSSEEIPHIETINPIRRTIEYAISLGGDTDTIASMAGAIAGSYYSLDSIPSSFLNYAEEGSEILNLGEKLFELVSESKMKT